jgi:hypothetical protein
MSERSGRWSRREFLSAGAAGLMLLSPALGAASVARALSLRELCRMSERVVIGTAVHAQSSWVVSHGRRRIVTDVIVRVDSMLAGPDADRELIFRTLGGRIGDDGEIVHGEAMLLIGKTAVLFATAADGGVRRVAGMSQGHYPLRVVNGERVLAPSPRSFTLVGKDSARARLVGKRLADAAGVIRSAFDAR